MTTELDELAGAAAEIVGRPVRPIRMLTGGEHARTALVADDHRELIVRRFPTGDPAPQREREVLRHLDPLGPLVPRWIGARGDVVVTTRVPGGPPPPDLAPIRIATSMARMLARIHSLDARALESVRPPTVGDTPLGKLVAGDRGVLEIGDAEEPSDRVVVHRDAWCGNALWEGDELVGMVDWSGAGSGPAAFDVAWSRNDLVLLGDPAAADALLAEYRRLSTRPLIDIDRWDRVVAAVADAQVESWAPNYAGIGRPIPPAVLRRRLDEWVAGLFGPLV